jgi:hypothetical protein
MEIHQACSWLPLAPSLRASTGDNPQIEKAAKASNNCRLGRRRAFPDVGRIPL